MRLAYRRKPSMIRVDDAVTLIGGWAYLLGFFTALAYAIWLDKVL